MVLTKVQAPDPWMTKMSFYIHRDPSNLQKLIHRPQCNAR